ncbi:MAG: uracil-DNA glycosylase family protein [Bacteroides sp.]|nr:uracil-DNA glycosylase family protein [Bacteroides sp.]MCM1414185.1 uracil-DNA glycosylase family protein [Bacteroides sp.]MCM1472007.1 uracil-DNA glycosylase family protein [Bacteroides sp.]
MSPTGNDPIAIETHPFAPFIPDGAKILIMGTFPPQPKRWSMEFYYPNPTNDFWPMMGLIFLGDRNALKIPGEKRFDLDAIKHLLTQEHIALHDTGHRIRRLNDNASDKFLEIVEPTNLAALLEQMPQCHTIATTGEKAAQIVASLTDTEVPKMGKYVTSANGLKIWRMPSTSRAYPLALEKKAAFYRTMFSEL